MKSPNLSPKALTADRPELLKYPASTWVHPMHPRAHDAFYQLKRLRIIGDRWIMGPSLRFLAGGGATVDENGHDLRSFGFS